MKDKIYETTLTQRWFFENVDDSNKMLARRLKEKRNNSYKLPNSDKKSCHSGPYIYEKMKIYY